MTLLAECLARALEPDDGLRAAGVRPGPGRRWGHPRDLRSAVVEVAAAEVAPAERMEVGLVRAADLLGDRAAVGEDAAGQLRAELGQVAGDRVEAIAVLPQPAARNATQEPDGVRMPRVGEDRLGGALLHEPSGVEDADPLAHLADDRRGCG